MKTQLLLLGSPDPITFIINPEDSVSLVKGKAFEQLNVGESKREEFGLYLEASAENHHLYISKESVAIGMYGITENALLILKPKPVNVALLSVKHIMIDVNQSLSNFHDELTHIMGYSSRDSIKILYDQTSNSPPTNNAFGVKRGICLLNNCDCHLYQKTEAGPCANCGHYPASHRNLGALLPPGSEEKYTEVDYQSSFEAQNMNVATESSSPLIMKVNEYKSGPHYLGIAKQVITRRRGSLPTTKKLRNGSGAAESYKHVLNALPTTDDGARLKKWAVRYNDAKEHQTGRVFGVPLTEVMELPHQNFAVPDFVVKITQYLVANALEHPGLFRLSGNQQKVAQLKLHIDQGRDLVFEDYDIDTISSVLKQYLQALPEPILTNFLYPRFITVSEMTDSDLQIDYARSLVNSLPGVHLDLLRYLVQFLLKVIAHEEVNKMTIHNISIVFGPILLNTNTDNPTIMLAHANLVATITELLLTKHKNIFDSTIAHSIHTVQALNPYEPKKGEEGALRVEEGKVIHVFKKDNTIWYGEIDGSVGFFPRSDITRSSKVIIIKENSTDVPARCKPVRSATVGHINSLHPNANALHAPVHKSVSRQLSRGFKKSKKKERKASLVLEQTTTNPLFGVQTSPNSRPNSPRFSVPHRNVATKTLPKGFDPKVASLETYLSEEDYQNIFHCTKDQFDALTLAEQCELKEKAGIFNK